MFLSADAAPWRRPATNLALGAIAAVVLGVVTTSMVLHPLPHGTIILPWDFPYWAILPVFFAGLFVAGFVYLEPRHFLSTLVALACATGGMFVLRFPVLDEWLLGWAILGALAAVARKKVDRREDRMTKWDLLFGLAAAHLLIAGLVGQLRFGNLKAIRFALLGAVLLATFLLLRLYRFPRPPMTRIVRVAGGSALAYFLLVFFVNLVGPQATPGRFEGIGGSGAGHLLAVGIVSMPVALILMTDPRRSWRVMAWATLLAGLALAGLADSRSGFLVAGVAILCSPFILGWRTPARVVAVLLAGSVLFGAIAFDRPQWPLDMGEAIIKTFDVREGGRTYDYYGREVQIAHGDAGRFLYVEAAFAALRAEGPLTLLTGTGAYGYFPTAGDELLAMQIDRGIPTGSVNNGTSLGVSEPPRPPAMGVILLELGVGGASILLACAALATRAAWRLGGALRLLAICAPLCIAWAFFGEIQELVLFYLVIMPAGLMPKGSRP